jgi:YbbR domain-containing protein
LNTRKFLEKVTEKWHIKVLSVAVALVIFIFYRMNTLETRFFTVPLQIEANEYLIPVSSFANTVRINIRGEAGGIHAILEEDIEAYIDLNKYATEGTHRIPVQIRRKGSALGIGPLEISVIPIEIPLSLEQKVSRNIPVFPVFSGAIAQGYELTSQSIIPERVAAEGPRSILDNQFEFITETIDLEGRYGNFSVLAGIVNANPLITIHGNRMIEYRGVIRRIVRESDFIILESEEEIENGDNGQ